MKRYLLWAFERGSTQYDVICTIIVAFIFLTPNTAFDDRPAFMRWNGSVAVQRRQDDNRNTVYTVQINTPVFTAEATRRQAAEDALKQAVNEPFTVSKLLRIDDTFGIPRAYAIWIEK